MKIIYFYGTFSCEKRKFRVSSVLDPLSINSFFCFSEESQKKIPLEEIRSKIQERYKKEWRRIISFDDLYDLSKKITPLITDENFEKILKKAISIIKKYKPIESENYDRELLDRVV